MAATPRTLFLCVCFPMKLLLTTRLLAGHTPSGQEVPTILGSNRVGSEGINSLDSHESERVGQKRFSHITVRFGPPCPDPTRPARGDPARELPWLFSPIDIRHPHCPCRGFVLEVDKLCGGGHKV